MKNDIKIKLTIKTEIVYQLLSEIHSDICHYSTRQEEYSELSLEACMKILRLWSVLKGEKNE